MDAETFAWILAAGLATGVGGLALLAVRDPSERLLDGLLGFTAGIMLAATDFFTSYLRSACSFRRSTSGR